MWVDLQRWARRLSVPLALPPGFPVASILALRAALEAERLGKLVPCTHAVFRAYWAEGKDIASAEDGEEMFVGNDRLDFACEALDRAAHGA
jgi:2-hydroxychromene-2-carboxylate isomerase